MKKSIEILILLMCLPTLGLVQKRNLQLADYEGFKNKIGIQLGYNQGYLKDLNFSVLNYQEGGVMYSLQYSRQQPNGKSIFNVDGDFSLGKLKTSASDDLTSSITMSNLEISYVRLLSPKEQTTRFYLGGQYNTYLQILDWNNLESFSFLVTHGVGVKGLLAYNFNPKHQFTTTLFIPIFQNLVRPPYNGIDETVLENQDNTVKLIFLGKPSSFNTYVAFDWTFNYAYSLSNKFALTATYLVRYQQVIEINRTKHLQNQLTVGMDYKF